MLGTTTSFLDATTTLVQTFYHIPIAWFVVFVIFVICAFDCYRSGGARTSAAFIAFVFAIFLVDMVATSFGMGEIIKAFHVDAYPWIIIGALFLIFGFIIGRMIEPTIGAGGPLSGLIGGLGAVVLFLALWVGSPALSGLLHFDPIVESVFTESFRLYWIMVGFIALTLARG